MALTGHDQGVKDRGALAGLGVTNKQPVLLSDARGPDRIFDEIIVEPRLAEPQMLHQGLPLVEQVIAHSAHTGFGPHALSGQKRQAFKLAIVRTIPSGLSRSSSLCEGSSLRSSHCKRPAGDLLGGRNRSG